MSKKQLWLAAVAGLSMILATDAALAAGPQGRGAGRGTRTGTQQRLQLRDGSCGNAANCPAGGAQLRQQRQGSGGQGGQGQRIRARDCSR